MTDTTAEPRYAIADMADLPPQPCPCGTSRRAFTDVPGSPASMHVVEIKADSETHYHKHMTEIYHVLSGTGEMELDGRRFPIKPGTSILIRPGCRHRAIGKLTILNVAIPVFDPADEYVD